MSASIALTALAEGTKPTAAPLPLRAWLGMAAGLIGAFMALLNTQTTAFAVADIGGGVHAGFDGGAWITTAYSIGELAIIPITAALSVVFTTRFWVLVNVVAFLGFCVASAGAQSLHMLLILRLGQGLTGGALIPLAFKITLTTFTGDRKPLGIALFAVTSTFTPTIAATADGWITDSFGWTGIFYQNLIPAALCCICAWIGLPHEKINRGLLRQLDWTGALACACAFGCAACVFDQGMRLDWFQSPLISQLALLSVAFLLLFIWRELTAPKPLVDLRLLLWPQFGLPILENSLFRAGLLAASMVIPGYLVAVQNYRPLQVGTALLWVGLPQLMLAPAVLALSRRIDERILMTAGLLVFAWGCLMDWGLTSQWQQDQFFWGQVVQGLAQPFVQVPIMVISTSRIGKAEAGSANALFNTLKTFSTTVGAGLMTTLLTRREQFHSARLTESFGMLSGSYRDRLSELTAALAQPDISGQTRGLAMIAAQVRTQATTMAYADALVVIGITLLASISVVWLIPPPPAGSGLRTWHAVCIRSDQ
jgi:MFS transporter, DHA2 family, multidrug resistance protein